MSKITVGITTATALSVSSDTTGDIAFNVNDTGTGGNTAMKNEINNTLKLVLKESFNT